MISEIVYFQQQQEKKGITIFGMLPIYHFCENREMHS